ncbi:hypothetical protein BpHYR1_027999 [Brachionus plicatilis]|uniref:Uncharacterized protein n=1 Tax=Brachionus plicatilis TaxID=10195 RepID=A0A3M7RKQ1_BRAPC|nr:hypothetical protein BpHYR1_027999 [Brachionus plicatilis]
MPKNQNIIVLTFFTKFYLYLVKNFIFEILSLKKQRQNLSYLSSEGPKYVLDFSNSLIANAASAMPFHFISQHFNRVQISGGIKDVSNSQCRLFYIISRACHIICVFITLFMFFSTSTLKTKRNITTNLVRASKNFLHKCIQNSKWFRNSTIFYSNNYFAL